jgi:hypothetical protein
VVGTVLAWATLESTGTLWLAFIVTRLIGFIVGAFIQRTVIQPIRVRAARRMTCMFTPLPQSQVSDLDQGPANRSRSVNLSPCSEREQSLPLGPFQPRNLIFLSSRALVASKNFSSSSTARARRCRMPCKSPSKGARSGSVELHRLCPLFADRTQEDGK